MEAEAKTPQPEQKQAGVMAGQPITFGGVAAFAHVSWRRLFIVQAILAGGAVAAVLVLLFSAWLPAIESAIHNLPENGYILRGELAWPDLEPKQLNESRWLTVIVTPVNKHSFGQSADLRLELHAKEARFYSLLGYTRMEYGDDFSLLLSRPDAVPWWGARRPFFVAGAIVGTFIGLWLTWMLLALLYAPAAKFMAFWFDRDLTWPQAYRLSAAALLTPGRLQHRHRIIWPGLAAVGRAAGCLWVPFYDGLGLFAGCTRAFDQTVRGNLAGQRKSVRSPGP